MKILALDHVRPGVTMDDIAPHLKDEARHAWQNYGNGLFRELYFRGDRPGAVVIMECTDLDEAHAIMKKLPLVRKGLIELTFIPLGPFVHFASLFEPSHN